jgi:16S rRNA (adenine1518-N6/adenine1519-N6)-dimethyltransferase
MTPRENDGKPAGPRAAFAAPKRSLGQNFLTDANIARKIVAALDIQPGDAVLEIGPGRGALTRHILERNPGRFRVLEKDDELADRLAAEHGQHIEIIRGDALRHPWEALDAAEGWKIVGNLPYNIASPLIWDLVSRGNFARAVFMVQLEAGQRLAAKPGGKDYGGLSVWVQNHARVELLFKVPPQVFYPPPKVTSVVLQFFLHERRPAAEAAAVLAATIKLCFQQRRKQLGSILKSKGISEYSELISRLGLDQTARPETLAPEQFLTLSQSLMFDFPA